uniref:Putative tail tube protein n=1 Tax=Pedobacter sp. SI-33 TaxID=1620222 RepID=A0A0C5LDI5_9SPHI|nr:putative tail tube protein [Pedobacter sp. SI-33]
MATSFPSDFKSVLLILVGQALSNCHCMVMLPASSRSLISTVLLLIRFILISACQSQKVLSFTKIPRFMVTLPYFTKPGIFSVEKSGLLLLRYLITWFSTSNPDTS